MKTTSTTEGWVGGEEDLKGAAGQPSPAEVAQQAKEAEAAKAAKKAKKAKAKPPVLSLEESQARGAELLKVLAEAEVCLCLFHVPAAARHGPLWRAAAPSGGASCVHVRVHT